MTFSSQHLQDLPQPERAALYQVITLPGAAHVQWLIHVGISSSRHLSTIWHNSEVSSPPQPRPRTPCRVGQGCSWVLSHEPLLLSSPLSGGSSLIHIPNTKLCLRICFWGTQPEAFGSYEFQTRVNGVQSLLKSLLVSLLLTNSIS